MNPRGLARSACVACLCAALLAGCAPASLDRVAPSGSPLLARIDRSLSKAERYLAARQSADGAWRSDVYGFFKDGPPLTPHVVRALAGIGEGARQEMGPTIEKGAEYLSSLVDDRGVVSPPEELIYPVYTAADASKALAEGARTPKRARAMAAWLALLRRHQLVEPLGWDPADVDYGGWGYAQDPPRKKPPGAFRGPWDWSNLSATLYALDALHSAGLKSDDPVYGKALRFVTRCQNFTGGEAAPERAPPWADGGFFFGPSASIRNKAGAAIAPDGGEHFNSYGSMACDGLRALLICGLPAEHPRVVAARQWLERHYSVEHNPGRFVAGNEDLRDATFYYYACSLAQALEQLQQRHVPLAPARRQWASALADELMKRQRADGSWVNRFTDGKEDDPLVATPFAASALAICRRAMAKEF